MRKASLFANTYGMGLFFLIAAVAVPGLYAAGVIDISDVNRYGRYACFAIAAIGVDLIWGYTGILTLCHAMFFCFGGYAMGMYLAHNGPLDGDSIPRCLFVVSSEVSGLKLPWFWEPFKSLPVSVFLALLIPGIFAFVFGYFAFRSRVKGVYFSIITQATTLAAFNVFCLNQVKLCGTNGLTNFVTLAGHDLNQPATKVGLYILSVAALIAAYYGCKFVVKSRLGRILIAIRDNENRLRFSGYQPAYFKVFAFAFSAMLAGIAGMLYVPQNGIITPSVMLPVESIVMVVWVAMGGRGTLSGAVIGAIVFSVLRAKLTTELPNAWPFVLGGIAIAVVLFLPRGIIGTFIPEEGERKIESSDKPPLPDAPVPSAPASVTVTQEGAKA